jgi:hypothetical protein
VNRKLVFLNLTLLALAAALLWTLRNNWFSAQSRQRAVIQQQVQPKKLLAPPPVAPAQPVAPAEYLDVAARMLFSKDRNSTVVIEAPPPKPEPPEPPLPALPGYHGQMAIGEPVAFLSTAAAAQRSYRAGETIGEFKLVSFDKENIEFEWHGKSIQRKLDELRPKETAQVQPPSPARPAAAAAPGSTAAAAPGPAPASAGGLVPLGGSGSSSAAGTKDSGSDDPMFGPVQADGTRACEPGDKSPSGTVHSGYKKDMTVTLFGTVCHWEQNK